MCSTATGIKKHTNADKTGIMHEKRSCKVHISASSESWHLVRWGLRSRTTSQDRSYCPVPCLIPAHPSLGEPERNQAELSAVVHNQLLQSHKKYLKFTQIMVTACQDGLWYFFNPFSQMFWILNLVSQWAFGYLFQLTPNAATPSTCSWLLFQLQDLSQLLLL